MQSWEKSEICYSTWRNTRLVAALEIFSKSKFLWPPFLHQDSIPFLLSRFWFWGFWYLGNWTRLEKSPLPLLFRFFWVLQCYDVKFPRGLLKPWNCQARTRARFVVIPRNQRFVTALDFKSLGILARAPALWVLQCHNAKFPRGLPKPSNCQARTRARFVAAWTCFQGFWNSS